MSRIGVEIGIRSVRAVRVQTLPLGRARPATVKIAEATYDPSESGGVSFKDAVAALRDRLGTASQVAVAVDVPLLFAKHIKLPPLPAGEKRRMIALEPERFFPVRGEELVVAARDGSDNLVFATREEQLSGWLSALETLGPIDHVEPAPVALARALAAAGVKDGAFVVGADSDRVGLVQLQEGRVTGMRRVTKDAVALVDARRGNGHGPPSGSMQVGDAYLAAFGAALGVGSDLAQALLSQPTADRIARRRTRGVLLAALAFGVGVVLALLALDAARQREARAIERDAATLRERAEAVLAMQTELNALDQRSLAIGRLQATRPDPVRALRALTERLPKTAYLRMIRANGAEWQISGYAPDASSLVPLLERAPEFEGVRFLTAVSNERVGNRNYESFSLTFRVSPAP